jgi:hypothetical protein
MSNVIEMKATEKKHLNDLISAVTTQKKTFIPPKLRMQESIENDAKYLMALGAFIQEGQKQMAVLMSKKNLYEASKLNVEIMEAIAKYQANEGLVNDKQTHYDKVFLPMYEKEMAESKEKFAEVYLKVEAIIEAEHSSDDSKKIKDYLVKEKNDYDNSDMKDHEEYKNHMYKIFKRLINKQEEIIAVK